MQENNEGGQSQTVEAPVFEFETMSGQKVGFTESGAPVVAAPVETQSDPAPQQAPVTNDPPDQYKAQLEQMESQLARMKEYEDQLSQYKSNPMFGLLDGFDKGISVSLAGIGSRVICSFGPQSKIRLAPKINLPL